MTIYYSSYFYSVIELNSLCPHQKPSSTVTMNTERQKAAISQSLGSITVIMFSPKSAFGTQCREADSHSLPACLPACDRESEQLQEVSRSSGKSALCQGLHDAYHLCMFILFFKLFSLASLTMTHYFEKHPFRSKPNT